MRRHRDAIDGVIHSRPLFIYTRVSDGVVKDYRVCDAGAEDCEGCGVCAAAEEDGR